jgi:hypothetical protein
LLVLRPFWFDVSHLKSINRLMASAILSDT